MKHSEFSASGAERWLNCPASVKLSRMVPEPEPSSYAAEGTLAHGYFEAWLTDKYYFNGELMPHQFSNYEMYEVVKYSVDKTLELLSPQSKLLIEQKVSLSHIHPTMFGTSDVVIYDANTLWVIDFKYGAGKYVSVENDDGTLNLQLAFYALGSAHALNYKPKRVSVGIIQPRFAKDGVRSISISMRELKKYEKLFKHGVDKALESEPKIQEGPWCHWCRAKSVCPVKTKKRFDDLLSYF